MWRSIRWDKLIRAEYKDYDFAPPSDEHRKVFKQYYWNICFCQKCGRKDLFAYLQIHHIDKNYRNNTALNLVKLCLRCHTLAHKWDNIYPLMKKRYMFLTGEKLE